MKATAATYGRCPMWCGADHAYDGPAHSGLDGAPVELHDLSRGAHTVAYVDIEQRDGSAPRISVTGSRLGDVLLPVDDAKRLALAILARVDQAEATAV